MTKVCIVKAMVFPVVMYGCESWTIKNAEHWRIDVLSLLDSKEIKPVNPKGKISPEYALEGPMLKLKLQYFDHLIWRTDSLEKTLMLRKIEGRKEKGTTENEMVGWHHLFNRQELEKPLGVGDGQGGLASYSPWDCKKSDTTERLNWTYNLLYIYIYIYTHLYTYLQHIYVNIYTYVITADSCCCITETNITLWSNYILILKNKVLRMVEGLWCYEVFSVIISSVHMIIITEILHIASSDERV